jgi:hypothetical protein
VGHSISHPGGRRNSVDPSARSDRTCRLGSTCAIHCLIVICRIHSLTQLRLIYGISLSSLCTVIFYLIRTVLDFSSGLMLQVNDLSKDFHDEQIE